MGINCRKSREETSVTQVRDDGGMGKGNQILNMLGRSSQQNFLTHGYGIEKKGE